jgi:hypothetical protein
MNQISAASSAAVIARPAGVIYCSSRTGGHYYCPTLIFADAFEVHF